MADLKLLIKKYISNQKEIGNGINDKDRFKPDEKFYEDILNDIAKCRTYSDVYEVNPRGRYVIFDLLDDVGLYRVTIEKLA